MSCNVKNNLFITTDRPQIVTKQCNKRDTGCMKNERKMFVLFHLGWKF